MRDDVQFLRLGVCRAQIPPIRPPSHSLQSIRSLSSLPPHTSYLRAFAFARTSTSAAPVIVQHRALSLASLFRKPSGLPPPAVVASISKLEAEADAHPEDVEKQVALFGALVNTKVKPGLNTVVARWERTSEFVSTSAVISDAPANRPQHPSHTLIRSDTAFKLYLTALRELGLESSIASAVRRRDTLLAASSSTSAASASHTSDTAFATSAPAEVNTAETHAATSESSSSFSTVSPSQQAAQEVLAGKTTVARSVHTDFDALGAALGRGAGVPGNPIVVTLNERKW